MKKLILLASICLLFHSSLYAQQAANVISYQGLISSNGKPADSGMYAITVALYSDSGGGVCVWRDTYWSLVTNGVFNLSLGSHVPLPGAEAMDRPMWLGVSMNGSAELRPLSQLSSTPYAMNVADSSITAQKMATDYVSGISIDGTKITNRGGALNLSSEGVVKFQFDSSSNSVFANLPIASVPNSSVYWSESGNNSTTPGLNYVGTSDSVALEIHVNDGGDTMAGNGRVMRYEPMPHSPNLIGGYRGNYITSSDSGGNVIAGGGNFTFPNWVAGNYATVGGGLDNAAYTGGTVAGGSANFANEFGTISGGTENGANQGAVVGGGSGNFANPFWTTIGGGFGNNINNATGDIAGWYSAIGGGVSNDIQGPGSAIPGGGYLTLGKFSFGFNGDSLESVGRITGVAGLSGIAYFGNVNMMIGNVDSVARQLQFFGPNTDDNYGSGAKYTAFRAPLMDSDVLYTLPKAQGATNSVLTNDGTGQLAWDTLPPERDTTEWLLDGNHGTAPPTNFLGTTDSNSLELHIFDSGSSIYGAKRVMRYEVNDTSANILGGYHDNAIIPLDTSLHSHIVGVVIAGGGANSHVNTVTGSYAVISGGRRNSDTVFAFVGGGDTNSASGAYSVVTGGSNNVASANFANVGGGINNIASGTYSSVGGGSDDTATGDHAVVAGGLNNTNEGNFSAISGGDSNKVLDSANYSYIGGGYGNVIYPGVLAASILAGKYNYNQGPAATIAGGKWDTIGFTNFDNRSGSGCFIGAGLYNKVDGSGDRSDADTNSAIVAGSYNFVGDNSSFIGAGEKDTVDEDHSFIIAGQANVIYVGAFFSGIGAGDANYVYGQESMIGAGTENIIYNGNGTSFIGAGATNIVSGVSDFIGSGTLDRIYPNDAAIVAGKENVIDSTASYAFIGAGVGDSARAIGSFIGGGQDNVTDTGATLAGGWYANIPGGDHLKSQSYAQTVIGFHNKPQGTSTGAASPYTRNPNDRVFIIGNGTGPSISSITDSNAFEVTIGGSSIVYNTNGSGGASTTPPHLPGNGAVYGARSRDNTCYAWGDVKGIGGTGDTCHVNSDFGVDSIVYKAKGDYRVYLHTVDPYLGTQVNFSDGFSVTATSVVLLGGIVNNVVTVTPINSGGIGSNAFEIYLVTPSSIPSLIDGEVMFQVFGRQ